MKRVLFIDTTHPILPELLQKAGYACDQFSGYQRNDYLQIAGEYVGVIVRGGIAIDKEFLGRAVNLKFIARVGAGMENIDETYAKQQGIACLNAPEGNRDAVGEHTIGMLLALLNNLLYADSQVRQGLWLREANRGTEIMGKTVGIIGYGNMGSAFAQRLSGFGTRVIAYDKYKTNYASRFVEESDMDTLFNETDILSLHVPLTAETDYLVDDSYLNRFSKPLYLINTSRGRVVKTHDLVTKIKEGKVLGAALDVIEYETKTLESLESTPPDFKFLTACRNVILTPHIAGWTHESLLKLAEVLVEKILKLEI